MKFLIRDRGGQFTDAFDAILADAGLRVIKSPPQAPKANEHCERLIGTLRRELLGSLLILNEHHLRRTLTRHLAHYNAARPHRRPKRPGCPPTLQSIRALILRLVRENPGWATGRSTESSPRSASRSRPPPSGRPSSSKGSIRRPNGHSARGPTSCAPKLMRCRLATSSRPSPSLGNASTSWPSSSTPAGASVCWVPPPIRPRAGSSR
ncbi:integrase core domain-containing protein [Nonomuraea sp. NPDC003707]